LTHEIELKALLTEEKYKELIGKLSSFKLINEDTIHTTRYRPGDIRLRFSDKMFEIVEKQGDPTQISRKEIITKIAGKEEFEAKKKELEESGFKADPSWIKHKKEFAYPYNGFEYIVCLQHVENFAYILEVEFMADKDDVELHEPNIRAIMMRLGVELIEPEEFKNKIDEYIKANNSNC
jgi:adenylate cyclase class IV